MRKISRSSTLLGYEDVSVIDSLSRVSANKTTLTIEGLTTLARLDYAGRTIEVPLRAELKDNCDDSVDPSLTLLIAHAQLRDAFMQQKIEEVKASALLS